MKNNINTALLHTKDEVITQIVAAINIAISENIYEDYQRSELDRLHSNSFYQRIWDHINNNLSKICLPNIIGGFTKRGFWNAYSLFDKETGLIYSFLREKRFREIARKIKTNPHYVQALAAQGNPDLQPPQMTFFSMEPDQTKSKYIFEQVCSDLMITPDMVKGHKVILFNGYNGILTSVRCCMIDWAFEIHNSIDLTSYINVYESVIVEEISEPISKTNNPSQGLKLKPKAKEKIALKDNLDFEKKKDDSKTKIE